MRLLTTAADMRAWSRGAHAAGKTIGFVPTMGYLHEGHISLVRHARAICDTVAASVFVNPAQFGPSEDFARYPRDPARDETMLREARVDVLFHPSVEEMYPGGAGAQRAWITVEGLSDTLEGAARPGHFRGVATVVAKLLNIVEPDVACFGQKDAQQACVIAVMARDLNVAARIEVCPTVREADGLAMSSRNSYLSPAERAAAPVLHRALCAAAELAEAGERSPRAIVNRARLVLAGEPLFRTEYVELVGREDLHPLPEGGPGGEALLLVAGRMGHTRLIDNRIVAVKG